MVLNARFFFPAEIEFQSRGIFDIINHIINNHIIIIILSSSSSSFASYPS